MGELIVLNRKEKERIFEFLKYYDIKDFSYFDDKIVLVKKKRDGSERIYVISESFSKVDLTNVRIDSLGLYFGEIRNNELRLSIEGSQVFGPQSSKKILLNKYSLNKYILGENIDLSQVKDSSKDNLDYKTGFYIVTNGQDFFGSAKIKNGILLNFYPKERRVGALHDI